jgi:hypothetical protein
LGHFVAGRTWAHFFYDRALSGLVLRGRADVGQVREMAAEAPERSGVHRSIIDAMRISGVDAAGFLEFSRLMGKRGAVLGENATWGA